MLLALTIWPTLAILAGLALVAIAPPHERHALILPAVRTVALITIATILVTALFHYGAPA